MVLWLCQRSCIWNNILIEHIFVPIRDLNAAAESRRHVSKTGLSNLAFSERLRYIFKPKSFAGGLWHISPINKARQEEVLLMQINKLMLAISGSDIPITLINYPKLTKDSAYLFSKLQPVLKNIEYKFFNEKFNEVIKQELIHSFNGCDC